MLGTLPRPATGWCRTRPAPTSSSSTPAASSRAPRRSRSRPSSSSPRMKEEGRCKKLVVAGCLTQRYHEEMAREMPEVDHFVGTGAYADIAAIVSDAQAEAGHRPRPRLRPLRLDAAGELARHATPPTSRSPRAATTPAPSASSRRCAGPQRSRTVDDVVAEAEALAAQGVVELSLVAQDLTAYGQDLPGQGAAPPPAPRAVPGRGHPLDPAPLRLPARLPRRARRGHRPASRRSPSTWTCRCSTPPTGCSAP